MGVSIKLVGLNVNKVTKRILNDNIKLGIAKMVEGKMAPYVPREEGFLMENTTVEPDSITYEEPYAHRQYKGNKFNFSKEQNPLATAEWDKAMMKAKGKQVIKEAEEIIERG